VLVGPVLVGPVLVGPVLVGPVLVGPVLVGPVLVGPVLVGPVLVGPALVVRMRSTIARLSPVRAASSRVLTPRLDSSTMRRFRTGRAAWARAVRKRTVCADPTSNSAAPGISSPTRASSARRVKSGSRGPAPMAAWTEWLTHWRLTPARSLTTAVATPA
jgi:hypothetical protein